MEQYYPAKSGMAYTAPGTYSDQTFPQWDQGMVRKQSPMPGGRPAWLVVVGTLYMLLCGHLALAAGRLETANVMAPLHIGNESDWKTFEKQLDTVKSYGVDAVSADVWWGAVEGSSDNSFDWSYYDRLFSIIRTHGIRIVPILSFHRCGGNVGDTYTSLLPPWLWTKYIVRNFKGIEIKDTDLQYMSEQGRYSDEVLQLWADDLVINEYVDFVREFADHFAAYTHVFAEINVSTGPSGELRYPSYNSHDSNSGYPTRGALQAYSLLAVQDFQTKMLSKYGGLNGVNSAWGIQLSSADKIQPPSNAEFFFSSADYWNIQYGRDFIDWYNQALVDHGRTLLTTVMGALGNSFPSASIGFKVPGVHWTMTHPKYPRAAEVAAGLIQTSVDPTSSTTGHGYSKIVGLGTIQSSPARRIVLHFTCLEMDDQTGPDAYSQAKSLVFWVAQEAARQGVTIKGENALASGVGSEAGWNNIINAFDHAAYSGLTTLRIGDVVNGTGQSRYRDFIKTHRFFPSLFVRGSNNGWDKTPMTRSGTVWLLERVVFGNRDMERFKFDIHGDWTQNFGGEGTSGIATPNGQDIKPIFDSSKTQQADNQRVAKTLQALGTTFRLDRSSPQETSRRVGGAATPAAAMALWA